MKTDLDLVEQGIAALLADHDPRCEDTETFFGAQFDAGLAWVHFPRGSGGLGVAAGLQRVVEDRLRAAGAKRAFMRNPLGVGMAAPTLLQHADAQQMRQFLRPMFQCVEIWCQLFSEPGAGSDLAGLATRAVRDNNAWVVNGQKVWTSLAHQARWGMLLARTDPDLPKHQGITFFVLDMQDPGVEVRPLRQATGDCEFNEVFLDNVRIPDSLRIGPVGGGWKVANTTLTSERAALSGAGSGAANLGGGTIDKLVELAVANGRWDDPAERSRVVSLVVESRLIRATNQRLRAELRSGHNVGAKGSITKMFQGLHNRRLQHAMVDIGRAAAVAWDPADEDTAARANGFLRAQGNTIEGGTTNILKNIVAERVLGLPREPGLPSDTPWKDIPRS